MSAPGTAASYRSTLEDEARDGFGRLLLAEWTKLRTVRRWVLALPAVVLLAVLVALLTAASSESTGSGDGPSDPARLQIIDLGHFTYLPLAGDGSIVARVTAQEGGGGWAKAGLMIRGSAGQGAPYAALAVTPGHGVRLQTGYKSGGAYGGTGAVPRWLKLTRAGTEVTGYASSDGRGWNRVGSVRLDGLPGKALAGMFVSAPDVVEVKRVFGGESVSGSPGRTGRRSTRSRWRRRSREPRGATAAPWAGRRPTRPWTAAPGPAGRSR
ncbi:DUF1349 domain-containing protein [Actinomadura sp. WMMA1423]|uniref:DUF1349 domain-containing protein n=1 Tax=Actinomadura sp. WMMA1423 TaxID=2591108 RepID=UPI001146DAD4|nr:DUF1349 domain-containing protein [Actinomadura sp. WMMA1423]